MSKYVNHKHGLTIGSDNEFFVIDKSDPNHPPIELDEGVSDIRDGYKAILSFRNYNFKLYTFLHVNVLTPAQQIFWERKSIHWTENFVPSNGETILLPMQKTYYIPNFWWVNWMNNEIGPKYESWDTYTRPIRGSEFCLFFKQRKSAMVVVKKISSLLEGIKIE